MNQALLAILLFAPSFTFAQTDMGRILPAEHPVHFFAIGNFGTGSPHQMAVADAMAHRNREIPFDFGITLGDNFYHCGVRSTKDEIWKRRFEDVYSPLGVKIFASLGNYDYGRPLVRCPAHGASPDVEIAYTAKSETWRMPARYYTYAAGPARFFALDTEGWSNGQLEWLRKALADSQNESGIKWRIVYGHHPVLTSGGQEDGHQLAVIHDALDPVLKEGHVDVYLAGHDRDMEHLRSEGIEYAVCGAGGEELGKLGRTRPESVFHAAAYGFADVTLDDQRLTLRFFDTALHSLEDPEPAIRK